MTVTIDGTTGIKGALSWQSVQTASFTALSNCAYPINDNRYQWDEAVASWVILST